MTMKNKRIPMTMLALTKGLKMSTIGPNSPCRGSNNPQLSACACAEESVAFSPAVFFETSTPPFARLPLVFAFEPTVPARALEVTPALSALTRSFACVDCPSFAPFSMGPETSFSERNESEDPLTYL